MGLFDIGTKSALVIMAIISTALTGPLVRLLSKENSNEIAEPNSIPAQEEVICEPPKLAEIADSV